jgi:drug/metabolite transporter (DMT)-like permease
MPNSAYIYYIITILIWGTTWYPLKLQLGEVSPEFSIVYRFSFASLLLLLWCNFKNLPMRFTLKEHLNIALLGLTFFSVNYVLFYYGSQYLTSGLVAVIFSLLAIMNAINTRLFFNEPIEINVVAGSCSGIIGLTIIFWPELTQFSLNSEVSMSILLCLGGTVVASLGCMVSSKIHRDGLPIIQTNAYGMCYGVLFLSPVLIISEQPITLDFSMTYIFSLLYLALFGSVIAFGCYFTLIKKIGASRAAYTTVFFPIIALFVSSIFEGYQWNLSIFIAIGLIIMGNIMIITKKELSKGSSTEL